MRVCVRGVCERDGLLPVGVIRATVPQCIATLLRCTRSPHQAAAGCEGACCNGCLRVSYAPSLGRLRCTQSSPPHLHQTPPPWPASPCGPCHVPAGPLRVCAPCNSRCRRFQDRLQTCMLPGSCQTAARTAAPCEYGSNGCSETKWNGCMRGAEVETAGVAVLAMQEKCCQQQHNVGNVCCYMDTIVHSSAPCLQCGVVCVLAMHASHASDHEEHDPTHTWLSCRP